LLKKNEYKLPVQSVPPNSHTSSHGNVKGAGGKQRRGREGEEATSTKEEHPFLRQQPTPRPVQINNKGTSFTDCRATRLVSLPATQPK